MAGILIGLLLLSGPRHDVLVVDDTPGPSTEFATIQAAVLAAPDGATVLVRPGTYAPFTVTAKELSVVGITEGGLTPLLQGDPITVTGLAADQAVVIRGFEVKAGTALQNCLGPVLLEDLRNTAGTSGYLKVTACEDVVLVRDEFQSASTHGGSIVGSSIYAYDVEFGGATGGYTGLRLEQSFAFLSGCTAAGGTGSPGSDGSTFWPYCSSGGPGGAGLWLSSSSCMSLDSSFYGGPGGTPGIPDPWSGAPSCSYGPYGPQVVGTGLVELPGTSREFAISSPGPEAKSVSLHAMGPAGEHVFAFVGASLVPQWFPAWSGALAVNLSAPLLFVGVLPPSGVINASVAVGELGPGIEGVGLVAQPVFVPLAGAVVLGPPTAVELIDRDVLLDD